MEFRKIISFGKTSFVMSIPKDWIVKNKLKKGDIITIDEKEGYLALSPKREKKEPMEQKEIIIDVTGKDINKIKRELTSAYINNFNPIVITGKDITESASEIRKALGDLIALEIMEQSSNKLIARDFLNMEKISIKDSVKKMDMLLRSMLADSKSMETDSDFKSIYSRDEDVNRLVFLIYRAIKCAFDEPEIMKIYNLTPYELVNFWVIVTSIEKIADNIKRIARNFKEGCPEPEIREQLLSFYSTVEKRYTNTIKTFYNKDYISSIEIAQSKKEVLISLEEFAKKSRNQLVWDTIDKMQQMIADIHDITRIVYLFLHSNKENKTQ